MGMVSNTIERRAETRGRIGASMHPASLDDPRTVFGTGYLDDATGSNLTEREVLGWPAVWQAMRMLSWSIGMMPCHLYKREGAGSKKLTAAREHPLYTILHDEPHPEYTPFEHTAGLLFNSGFRGNGYSQIMRDGQARISGLFPLDTHRMIGIDRKNGRLFYRYQQANGQIRVFPQEEILHVRGFGDGGILGLALQQIAPTSLAKGVAMDRFGGRVFKQGVGGNAVVETEAMDRPIQWKNDSEKKEFFDKISDSLQGEDNWHKVIGLPMGMKLRTLGITAKEAQLVEGLTFQVQDIARLTGVPPSLLMDLSRATFSNSEQQMLQFIQLALGPWIVNLEQRFQKSLLLPHERGTYTIKFLVDALLRTDLKTQNEALRVAVGQPWMSVNEARDLKELTPLKGAEFDSVSQPLNMGNPGGNPGQSTEGKAPKQDGDSKTRNDSSACSCEGCTTRTAHATTKEPQTTDRQSDISPERRAEIRDKTRERQALRKAFKRQILRDSERLVRGVVREVSKLADKHLDTRDAGSFGKATEDYFTKDAGFPSAVRKILGPLLESYAEAVVEAVAREQETEAPSLADFVKNYIKAFIERKGGSLWGQIEKLIKETDPDKIADAIKQRLTEWEQGREDGERMSQAEKIADQESVKLGDAMARAAFAAAGVTRLVWLANAGACPICMELDGQVVGIEEVFVEKSAQIDPADDNVIPLQTKQSISHAPLHQGCECTIAAA